ncbi:acyl-CoA/acyl-ACP dehydrogenase [Gammaproteobacteria bacterium]|nr:acyl-CoA/acyl-ACP dehydrogenase [Gammaproteobacteria bacterium]
MNLRLNEEQRILKDSAKSFLDRECSRQLMRNRRESSDDYDRSLWFKLAGLGWTSLVIDENFGGVGGSFEDLSIVIEQLGAACAPIPFFGTSVLGASALSKSKNNEIKADLLPQIVTGDCTISYAFAEPGVAYQRDKISLEIAPVDDRLVINGIKLFVEYGLSVDYFLVVGRLSRELALVMVDAKSIGIHKLLSATLDYAGQCEVVFTNVSVSSSAILASGKEAEELLSELEDIAAVGKCAEIVGCVQNVLEMTVSYVSKREQFGQLVGSFQSVQHHCANMAVGVDSIRSLMRLAMSKVSQGTNAAKEVSMAKAYASSTAVSLVKLGHQVHGAVSFCDDLDMHLYLRRVHAASVAHGDAEYHYEKVAKSVGI